MAKIYIKGKCYFCAELWLVFRLTCITYKVIKYTYTHEKFENKSLQMSKTAAPQKSITKEMTNAKIDD